MEEDVGIHEYAEPACVPLRGIVKQRYSDFCVNEIDEHGAVAELTCAVLDDTLLAVETATIKEEQVPSEDDVRRNVSEEAGEDFIRALCAALKMDAPLPTSAPIASKDVRTAVHKAVRELSSGKLSSTTTPSGAVAVVRATARDARRASGPRMRYMRCVLWKELMGTAEAVSALVRRLHVLPRDVSYAGTKDRRAVTAQYVCVAVKNNITARRLASAGGTLAADGTFNAPVSTGRPRWALGNVESASEPLGLGDLCGNRFTLVLRDAAFDGDVAALQATLSRLETSGFVNYYGLQRFGTGSTPTQCVGLALLCGDFASAVALIIGGAPAEEGAGKYLVAGRPRDCRRSDDLMEPHERAREIFWSTKDAAKALAVLPARCLAERAILAHYARAGRDWRADARAAIAAVPRETRLLYVHAFQSALWNALASRAVRDAHAAGVALSTLGELAVPGYETMDEIDADCFERVLSDVSNGLLSAASYAAACRMPNLWDLSGAHRALIVRATALRVTVGRYDNADDPLSHNVLSRNPLAPGDAVIGRGTAVCGIEGAEEGHAISAGDRVGDAAAGLEGRHVGVALSFDLPAAAYATMALREVMRSSTAPSVHASLTAVHRSN